ncbi:MAG: cell wall hydrolase [Clostridia bacterium]
MIKKYIIFSFTLTYLVFFLFLSMNNKKIIFNKLYAKSSSTSTTKANTGSDMTSLLARLVNGEAEGEPYLGQVAVAAVILNRVKSSEFPNTISGVIYQKGQFSCVKDGNFDKPIKKDSTVYKAAKEAMNGADPTNGALYFYNPKTAKSKWLYSLKTVKTISNHVFAIETKK